MHSLAVFNKAVIDTVDAMAAANVATVKELEEFRDANSLVEELYSYVTDLLWNDDHPDYAMDDALIVVNAAQAMADVMVAEMNGAAR